MKSDRRILVAFLLNMGFSVFELFGGMYTGSVAILSDALHDFGDAISIGISYILEKKSHKEADERHPFGHARYSVLGAIFTALTLIAGCIVIVYNAITRIIEPTQINYDGMILFAIVGIGVNLAAALFTRKGHSINQAVVTLHMLEDVWGWAAVLIGAVIMRFTDFPLIDPILSIIVAFFIFLHAVKHLKKALDIMLEKTPDGISTMELTSILKKIDGVEDVHHMKIWTLDEEVHCACLHITATDHSEQIKTAVRTLLEEKGITYITIEIDIIKKTP